MEFKSVLAASDHDGSKDKPLMKGVLVDYASVGGENEDLGDVDKRQGLLLNALKGMGQTVRPCMVVDLAAPANLDILVKKTGNSEAEKAERRKAEAEAEKAAALEAKKEESRERWRQLAVADAETEKLPIGAGTIGVGKEWNKQRNAASAAFIADLEACRQKKVQRDQDASKDDGTEGKDDDDKDKDNDNDKDGYSPYTDAMLADKNPPASKIVVPASQVANIDFLNPKMGESVVRANPAYPAYCWFQSMNLQLMYAGKTTGRVIPFPILSERPAEPGDSERPAPTPMDSTIYQVL